MAFKRVGMVFIIVLVGIMGGTSVDASDDVAQMSVGDTEIIWTVTHTDNRHTLTVTSSKGTVFEKTFGKGENPVFSLLDNCGNPFPDGYFSYNLRMLREFDAQTMEQLAAARNSCPDLGEQTAFLNPLTQGGLLLLEKQRIIFNNEEEPASSALRQPSLSTPMDITHNDDVIIDGSTCIGNDCYTGLAFGFDTLVFRENNLRIFFDDTSTISNYPRNDWGIEINASQDGGGNYFAIKDRTNTSTPFKIEADAPDAALYVDSHGDVGIGTSTPYYELHVLDGDTPTVRFDQDGSYGWAPQKWDIGANESNFFVRDATSASKLPFRIFPGASTDSLAIASSGRVGVGTSSPLAKLHVKTTGSSSDPIFLVERGLSSGTQATYLQVKDSGDVEIFKTLGESSDRNRKKNIQPADTTTVLRKLSALPLATWSYKTDDETIRHMGPMAQDFKATFGLGSDDKHISALDSSGVALAAIQELYKRVSDQEKIIQKQSEIIRKLNQKYDRLEAQLKRDQMGDPNRVAMVEKQ